MSLPFYQGTGSSKNPKVEQAQVSVFSVLSSIEQTTMIVDYGTTQTCQMMPIHPIHMVRVLLVRIEDATKCMGIGRRILEPTRSVVPTNHQ